MDPNAVAEALSLHMPSVIRWCGAIAKSLRNFDIAVTGKDSGNANTDALTLADLTVQELIVAALRDADPIFRTCRIEGEESTGDLVHFDESSEYGITIDPIDGTKQYRDKTGNGYGVMLQLQSYEQVLYSLVFLPEQSETGVWVEAIGDCVRCGNDNKARTAREVLDAMPNLHSDRQTDSKKIYLIGFQDKDPVRAQQVTDVGLEGFISDTMPGSIFSLMATGEFAGSLIHSPNIYDFPVSMQIARMRGGDAWWVHNKQPVNFHELWMDDRASMLRLPGIVACSDNMDVLNTLCDLAKDWNPIRYED